jgi:hypothetical protein
MAVIMFSHLFHPPKDLGIAIGIDIAIDYRKSRLSFNLNLKSRYPAAVPIAIPICWEWAEGFDLATGSSARNAGFFYQRLGMPMKNFGWLC